MDFKKNWAKLTMAAIAGILGLLFVVTMFIEIDGYSGLKMLDAGIETMFSGFNAFAILNLIPALFFLGVCAYILLKLFDIEMNKYMMLAVGAVNLLLFIIAIIVGGSFPGISIIELAIYWAPLVIYALFPLIKGINKLVGNADEAPAKAAPKASAK
jgi:hypothetical protein